MHAIPYPQTIVLMESTPPGSFAASISYMHERQRFGVFAEGNTPQEAINNLFTEIEKWLAQVNQEKIT